MNPQDQPEPTTQTTPYAPNPQPSAEEFQAIDSIEAEDSTTPMSTADDTLTAQSVAPLTSAEPIANTTTYTATESPVTVIAPKKSSKLLLIAAIAAFVLTACVAGFVIWQSIQEDASQPAATEQQTGGDLPGGDGVTVN